MRWIALLSLVLSIRLVALSGQATIINDGVDYLRMAELMADGEWREALGVGYHPGYPFLIFALGAFLPYAAAAHAIAVAAALAALPILWMLFRDASNERTAWWGVVIYAVHPTLVRMQVEILSTSLFVFLFAAFTLLLVRALETPTLRRGLLLAGCLALLYLVRPEGILATAAAVMTFAIQGIKQVRRGERDRARSLVVGFLPCLALALVGGAVVMATGAIKSSARAIWVVLAGGGAETGGLEAGSMLYEALESMTPFVWLLAVLGTPALRKNPAAHAAVAIGVGFFSVMSLGLGLVGYTGRHYYLPAAALLLLPAAAAVAEIHRRLPRLPANVLAAVLILAFALPTQRELREARLPYRWAGEWILSTQGPGSVVFAEKPQAAYYARGTFRRLPASVNELLSRPGQLVVAEAGDLGAGMLERKGLVALRAFPGGVVVYRITK